MVIDVFATSYGPYAGDIQALLKVAPFPDSVAGVLRDEVESGRATIADVGEAVREYLATGEHKFNAPLFRGFLRRIRGRKAQAREATEVKQHEARRSEETTEAAREQERRDTWITAYLGGLDSPAFDALRERADKLVAPTITRGRNILITGKMRELAEEVYRAQRQ